MKSEDCFEFGQNMVVGCAFSIEFMTDASASIDFSLWDPRLRVSPQCVELCNLFESARAVEVQGATWGTLKSTYR